MTLKLVSFNLCPFVQRSVITLREKGMDYELTYLTLDELKNPPAWFREISPFGKVPVLRVDDTTVFESAVIMEYIDEISPPSLHPADPLQRALNRAWMKFGEELLFTQYRYATAADETAFTQNRQELADSLDRLENVLADGPFFNGETFNLIDASFAPFFMRLDILEDRHSSDFYAGRPKVARWADACHDRDSVIHSVIEDLPQQYLSYIQNTGDYAARTFAATADTLD